MSENVEVKCKWNINEVLNKVQLNTETEMQQFLERVVNDAKERCPVRGSHRSFWTPEEAAKATPGISGGTLRNSITFKLDGRTLTGIVYTQAGYGGYVELGTKYMQARPFMKPAFDENVRSLLSDLENSL